MAQRGQHVLIVDESSGRRRILEVAMARTGRWATLAENGDEAMAVLRPALHPLVVTVDARVSYATGSGSPEPLLLALLANQEFAATHAFIAMVGYTSEDAMTELRESAERLAPAAYVRWLRLPIRLVDIVAAVGEAEQHLKARGQRPTP